MPFLQLCLNVLLIRKRDRLMMNRMLLLFVAMIVCQTLTNAQTREEKVRADREKVESEGFWIYNDLPKAFRQAKQSGKPILVVLRCIPCEECVKLDDELVDTDPVIKPLLEKFVCARQVSTNGLDLSLFQYDTDQSFAVFMLNADGVIYGRFGTRSHRTEWVGDVSTTGMGKALQAALDLHADYPNNKKQLQGKRGEPLEVASPEDYPLHKGRFTDRLNYRGDVVKSCIHCHQIGDAQRAYYWQAGRKIPEKVLFPYPHPTAVGLTMNPQTMATVKSVAENSNAAKAGIRAGDSILSFDGQPMISTADIQWVLHNIDPNGGSVPVTVQRGNRKLDLTLELESGWRRKGDISWRVTSWGLRRMVTGGMKLEELSDEERRELGLSADEMALEVAHVGQYGAHAAAKKAGVRKGDILTGYDGRTDLHDSTAVLSHGVMNHSPGDRIGLQLLRNGRTVRTQIPVQE